MACYSFSIVPDGTDIGANSNNTLADALVNFSVSAWIKTSVSGSQALVSKTFGAVGWYFEINTNVLRAVYNDGGGTNYVRDGMTLLNDGNWHNVIFTIANSNLTNNPGSVPDVYVDGILDNGTGIFGDPNGTNAVTLKIAGGGPSSLFTGNFADIRIWNVTLSPSDVTTVAGGGDVLGGLIAEWPMSEGSGVTLADSSGGGNTVTFNALAWSTDLPSQLPVCGSSKKKSSMFLVF